MAYFPNGSAGMVFDEQCARCRYGEEPCPIAFVQYEYNYGVCNNKVATGILGDLVENNGTCKMYETFKQDLSKKMNEPLGIQMALPKEVYIEIGNKQEVEE